MSITQNLNHMILSFSDRAKFLREMTRLSRRAFGLKHNISPATLQNIEEGRYKKVSERTAEKLLVAFQIEGLDITMQWLLTGTGDLPSYKFDTKLPIKMYFSKKNIKFGTILEQTIEREKKIKEIKNIYEHTRYGRINEIVEYIKNGGNIHLIEGKDLKPFDNEHHTLLHLAAKYGHLEIVKYLIKSGSNINAKNRKLERPLHLAILYGHHDTVIFLIKNNANVNAKEQEGGTPLAWAAYTGQLEMVNTILSSKEVDINSSDNFGYTSLHWAAQAGNSSILKLLIKSGGQVDHKNLDGNTVLDVAIKFGNVDAVKYLLSII